MLLEIGKALSFILSLLSLYPIVLSAFFVPGTHWEERLSLSLVKDRHGRLHLFRQRAVVFLARRAQTARASR